MDTDLFVYEMKKKGYRTPQQRAEVLGLSLSAYYNRTKNRTECTVGEMDKIVSLLGWEVTKRIFFGNEVS